MAWTKRTKPSTDYDGRYSYLLMEDGGFLLNEDGSFILISTEFSEYTPYTDRTKPVTSHTKRTKPSAPTHSKRTKPSTSWTKQ